MTERKEPLRKRHHSVPAKHLSRFSADDGLLWLYPKGGGASRRVHPDDAAVEKFLYAPETGENPKDDAIERLLAEVVDGPGSALVDKLIAGTALTSAERIKFAEYVCFQERRIPRMRDMLRDVQRRSNKIMLQLHAAHPEAMRTRLQLLGYNLSDEKFERIRDKWLTGEVAVEPTKSAWLDVLGYSADLAPMVAALPWAIAVVPEGRNAITSDAPVVKVLTDATVPRDMAGGWLSPSAETTFALDKRHILVIRPDGIEGRVGVTALWVDDVNRRTAMQCYRYFFSSESLGDTPWANSRHAAS